MLGALGGGGDEQFRLAVDLVAAGMMLADPRLGVIVHVQPLHELEVALHAEQRIFVVGVERRQEDPGAQRAELAHLRPPSDRAGILAAVAARAPAAALSPRARRRACYTGRKSIREGGLMATEQASYVYLGL